jgi:hypothetical protein
MPFLRRNWLFISACLLIMPFLFLGYGIDDDTFAVLATGRSLLTQSTYVPSRHPGYLVHELFTMILSYLGGSVLSNAGTMVMTILLLRSFYSICDFFELANKPLLTLVLLLHPLVLINASETIDYLWALGFLLSGFLLALRRRFLFAGIILGLAIGSRLSSFIAVIAIFGYLLWNEYPAKPSSKKNLLLWSFILTVVISGLSYLPSFVYAKYTLSFLTPHMADGEAWSLRSKIGKFVYKNVYFWGLPGFLVFCYCIFRMFNKQAFAFILQRKHLAVLCLSVIVGYEALFLIFPIQNEYLLPILPFILILIGIALQRRRLLIGVLLLLVTSFNFINVNVARPNVRRGATSASLGLWIEPGLLLKEVLVRELYKHCSDGACWKKVFETQVAIENAEAKE